MQALSFLSDMGFAHLFFQFLLRLGLGRSLLLHIDEALHFQIDDSHDKGDAEADGDKDTKEN